MSAEYAYIDPGTGSMILQIVLGGLAAVAVMAKFWWRRLLVLLRIREPEERKRTEVGAQAEPPTTERAEQRREPVARS